MCEWYNRPIIEVFTNRAHNNKNIGGLYKQKRSLQQAAQILRVQSMKPADLK